MDQRAKALIGMILAVLILSLTFGPIWSMASLILFGLIARRVRENAAPAVDASVDPPADAPAHAVEVFLSFNSSSPIPATPATRAAFVVDRAASNGLERKKRRKPEPSAFKNEVFLNFRGTDTCKTITNYLYKTLVDVGISVLKDDEELPVGEQIGPELEEAISSSRISIAILSIDYASSKRCLMELEQMRWSGQTIIPIFNDVSPSDVIHQAGDFGRAFNLHESAAGVDSDTIETWRDALRDIGELPGCTGKLYKGYEDQLAREAVARVVRALKGDPAVTDKPVGIDLHVQEMMRKLGVAHSEGRASEVRGEDIRVVGICGLPGVGKTTLAKVVFDKTHDLFDAWSFLPGIDSKEVQFSRRMLIADLRMQKPAPLESSDEGIEEMASLCRNVKVLIVLDDVDEDEQIQELAGNLTWFGPGSRIIVTTRKREVLNAFKVGAVDGQTVEEYKLEPMRDDHALQLFREHAFKEEAPKGVSEYDSLSVDIVKAVGGLPSDILDHASGLSYNMDIDVWKIALELLQKPPEDRPSIQSLWASAFGFSILDNQLTIPVQGPSINQSPFIS